jgi:tRNA (adenine57-N1/adenine58-N1)-methyltransferase
MSDGLRLGDAVLLYAPDRTTYLISLADGGKLGTHVGEIRHADIVGKHYGEIVRSSTGQPFVLLEPTLEDRMMKVRRLTQIIYPKDAGLILVKTGLRAGMRVIECGVGSGAATLCLASAVAPTGRVYAYDREPRFLEIACQNVERAGLAHLVEFKVRDVAEGFDEEQVDVVLLDLPSPWEGVPAARRALRGGGRLASLSPTFNQVERMVAALHAEGFVMIETVEVLLRHLLVRPGKTRPFERMIGHTGFLTFARRALHPLEEASEGEPLDPPS